MNRGDFLVLSATFGMISTTVLAVKATPKALKLIENKKERENKDDLTVKEIVKETWKCYIPTIIAGGISVFSLYSIKINYKSLLSSFYVLEKSYKNYKETAKDLYGEDANKDIIVHQAKQEYKNSSKYIKDVMLDAPEEDEPLLFYESFSGRYFTSTMFNVLMAEYKINRNLQLRSYINMNEFYDFMGLEQIDEHSILGFGYQNIWDDGLMWLDFYHDKTVLEDGMVCYVISYICNPTLIDDYPIEE